MGMKNGEAKKTVDKNKLGAVVQRMTKQKPRRESGRQLKYFLNTSLIYANKLM